MRFVAVAVVAALAESYAAAEGAAPAEPTAGTASRYTAEQARATVEQHVRDAARASGGVYRVPDRQSGKELELELDAAALVGDGSLWRVHDPERSVGEGTFFACVRFRPVGGPAGKLYDVDLLVEPQGGRLEVTDVRVHKERLVDGRWVWVTRKASSGASAAGKRP